MNPKDSRNLPWRKSADLVALIVRFEPDDVVGTVETYKH